MTYFEYVASITPRLADTMQPEELNTEGCLRLAQEILASARVELTEAARNAAKRPNFDTLDHYQRARRFYESDLFDALSLGAVDGRTAAELIVKDALDGSAVLLGGVIG